MFSKKIHSRLAPTPSGYLHTGNAFNFVLTWLQVRKAGGTLRLRIDDLDAQRARNEYLDDIFRSLEWLGIDWDEGPRSASELHNEYTQQSRVSLYNHVITQLIGTGKVFACTCSRKEVAEQTADHQYPGTCRHKNIPLNNPDACLRLLTPENTLVTFKDLARGECTVDLYQQARDFIIRRRDGLPAYHVASVADDNLYEVNLVVRGEDLLPSTAAQLYIAAHLPGNPFARSTFMHHRLIVDSQGNKLSKSVGSTSLRSIRNLAEGPARFYAMMAGWLGWQQQPVSAAQMLQCFAQGERLF